MSEQDNMSERVNAGAMPPERGALIAGGWDAWDAPGALPVPGDRVEWRNTDGTRSGVIDSYHVGPGVATLGGAQRAAGLVDTDFFWRVVDKAPDTVRSVREPEPLPPDSARDCAIRALGDAIERPHDGRLGEAVDALRDYALDGAPAPPPPPRHDAVPPPAKVPRGLTPLDRVPRGAKVAAVCMGAFAGASLTFLPGWVLGAALGAAVMLAGLGVRGAP